MLDLVIKNGHVIDPKNKISAKLNLGILDGKIACISNQALEGTEEIDAENLIVSPGFVDIHMHEDEYNSEEDSFQFCISHTMLRMGVTTAIGGNCGLTRGHENPLTYLDAVDRRGFPINMALLVPHDTLRRAIGVSDVYQGVCSEEIEEMIPQLKNFLEGGCIGFSMGVEYIPGTSKEEMQILLQATGDYHKVSSIHMRSDAEKSILAIQEMIDAAEATCAPLQISHIASMCSFGQMERALSLVDNYRAKGMDLRFDSYPYYAYCTSIGSAVFDDGFLDALNLGDEAYQRLEVASGTHVGERCTKESFRAIRESEPEALLVAHLLNEREVDEAITHPACIVASDGIYNNGQGHPRGAGTFPRFLYEYVINKKMLSLENAVEKITYASAKRFGLQKGTLSMGADADITIFDYNRIKGGATFSEPVKAPEGIEYVIIGGKVALRNSQILNDKLGKSIRALR